MDEVRAVQCAPRVAGLHTRAGVRARPSQPHPRQASLPAFGVTRPTTQLMRTMLTKASRGVRLGPQRALLPRAARGHPALRTSPRASCSSRQTPSPSPSARPLSEQFKSDIQYIMNLVRTTTTYVVIRITHSLTHSLSLPLILLGE